MGFPAKRLVALAFLPLMLTAGAPTASYVATGKDTQTFRYYNLDGTTAAKTTGNGEMMTTAEPVWQAIPANGDITQAYAIRTVSPETTLLDSKGKEIVIAVDAPSGSRTLLPDPEGVASGAASNPDTVWYLNGIDGNFLAVGNPNLLNRRDKVVIRFDITPLLPAGKVAKAVLVYTQTHFGYRDEAALLEHFTVERPVLSGNDLVSNSARETAKYVIAQGALAQLETVVNVSAEVNSDLQKGYGFTTFRIASISAEALANPENAATGLRIERNSIKLVITE